MKAKAVVIREPGGPEVLEVRAIDVREPSFGEVRVRVHAAGLNRADTLQRRGLYPAPKGAPSDVPGLEFAGEIERLGPGVEDRRVGERVMGICAGGGMAEAIVVHSRELVRIPEGLDWTPAAAVPEVFMTAYDALFLQGGLGPGQTVLLHAAASGIGTAGAQLARAVSARAIGTLRSAEKLPRLEPFGFSGLVVAEEKRFEGEVRALAPAGVDIILDTIGAAYLEQNLRVVARGGTIVTIGMMGGARAELPLGALLDKRVTLRGSVLRSRPLEEKIALARDFERAIVPLFETGRLAPVVDAVFGITEVAEAHRTMEANQNVGKLVVRLD